jgi:hypothetical protein
MPDLTNFLRTTVVLLAAATLIVLAYWPGLGGGFLLDDFENFSPLSSFVAGELTWQGAVFSNQSGPLGRPLSMASFAADAQLFGLDPRAFLRTNLVIHLGCSLLVLLLLQRLLTLAPQAVPGRVAWIALGLAFVWAVLPIHVSVVLYAVQRMALLSALFVFAALLVFVIARQRLRDGKSGWALPLFVGFPLFTALALLSKENGALAPLIASAIEIAWFRQPRSVREQRARALFFGLFLGLPVVLALAGLALAPERILSGYEVRNFTLAERMLTQPRVLWDYVQHIVLPFGPAMGLIHDDYPKSTTLLSPPATLAAIVAWIAALVLAWRLRSTAPAVLGGLLVFLAAHAMESTIFPLELYFEHRNYVAAVGVVIAVAGLVGAGHARLGSTTSSFRRALAAAAVLMPLTFAAATYARAMVWGDPQARMTQALAASPTSPRLRSQLAATVAETGDLAGAVEHIDKAASGPAAPPARTLDLWRILSACVAKASLAESGVMEAAIAATTPRIALTEMVSFEALAQRIEGGQCAWPSAAQAIELGQAMLAHTSQPATAHEVWRVRYNLARLLASTGDLGAAAALAQQAWADSRWNGGVGVLVFQLHASLGDLAACRATLERLRSHAGSDDLSLNKAIEQFDAFLADPDKAADVPAVESGP